MKSGRHELIGERSLYVGKVFELVRKSVRLASGRRQEIDVVRHPGAVAIAALDARGRLLLVRQYRAALEMETLEVPAGRVEPGETPLAAARRELEEETGMRAMHWRPLRTIHPAPGFCSEAIHLFHASGLEAIPGGGAACDEDEEIEIAWEEPEAILALETVDAKTLVCAALLTAGRSSGPGP